jgi:hypothetical protein
MSDLAFKCSLKSDKKSGKKESTDKGSAKIAKAETIRSKQKRQGKSCNKYEFDVNQHLAHKLIQILVALRL